ncbi:MULTISPECIES: transketolase [unclassified Pseudoclavibacter]|uniref:transketolase n=1 Tax=unclassified Pseudoclavibacter TaxID=2615177 RepID=UPI000CE7B7B3|nr:MULTISPECIES: transketolase [unclassified Pseudoclavibacter]MBS3178021.1 transketolase [Pseudoclavibacter sp. Marseille-Q4354]PPG29314.1 transketolase [Pseudoclavibacter sp. RFBB5]
MTNFEWSELDRRAVDTARILAADAVEKAKGGHPGTAMSLAPLATLLYQHVMRVDPKDPHWIGRDRFILSAGHSSLTQYTQLYLGGFGLELDDLKQLRQLGSKTPGHPEFGHTDHVEMTTGPLGQGLASAVGFAYAQRFERGLFDPEAAPGESPFDHRVYVIASDGDLQEGVTSEASSLAGHQELGNLIVFYDANQISIEDDTDIAFTEDVAKRYEAYGWHVQTVDWTAGEQYHEDLSALHDATLQAQAETGRPSIIVLKTIIGWPSPTKQNTGGIHGSALGETELEAVKSLVGFDPKQSFEVADDVLAYTRGLADRAAPVRAEWQQSFDAWKSANPERAELLERLEADELPEGIADALPDFAGVAKVSTRKASGEAINALAAQLPELWGGSADLAGSNNTTINGAASFIPSQFSTSSWTGNPYGRVLHFGIREHAMGAILNGITLHGKTRAFGGTFLMFSDYMRPSVRLAALMNIPSIFVWTHDSIALGGDGPTHQPVESLTALRAIPNLAVVRPADGPETAAAWLEVVSRRGGPTGLILSRQDLPVIARGSGDANEQEFGSAAGTKRGAYVLAEASGGTPEVILLATGSEVQYALEARETLQEQGHPTRVVSVPSFEWFAEQDAAYREHVLPAAVEARVSIEAGLALPWLQFVGPKGRSISIETFGASADQPELYKAYGITAEAVVDAALESLAQ